MDAGPGRAHLQSLGPAAAPADALVSFLPRLSRSFDGPMATQVDASPPLPAALEAVLVVSLAWCIDL